MYLGQGLVKGSGFDGIVRRSVELGVTKVFPISAKRCISKFSPKGIQTKSERWQRIAREAAKQCGRSKVPNINPIPISVKEFCYFNRHAELRLIFWEEERSTRVRNLLHKKNIVSAALLVGPEGGFSSEEIKDAAEYGFRPISLGPRLLRTDTAPLAILSVIQNHWGDL